MSQTDIEARLRWIEYHLYDLSRLRDEVGRFAQDVRMLRPAFESGGVDRSLLVTLLRAGVPRTGVTVTIKLSGVTIASGATDGSGQILFSGLAFPGTYTASAAEDCYAATGSVAVTTGLATLTISEVAPTFAIHVTKCGTNASGVTVTYDGTDYTTDGSGNVIIPVLVSGTFGYTVHDDADVDGIYATPSGTVTITGCVAPSTINVNLLRVIVPKLRITSIGTCMPTPDAYAGTGIEVFGVGSALTNSSAYVEFDDVPVGDYSVEIGRYGYRNVNEDFTIPPTCSNPYTLSYPLTKEWVDEFKVGPFKVCNNCPREGVDVLLTRTSGAFPDDDGYADLQTTDSAGYVTFANVREGYYTISASGSGYHLTSRTLKETGSGSAYHVQPDVSCFHVNFTPDLLLLTIDDPDKFCTPLCESTPPTTLTLETGSGSALGAAPMSVDCTNITVTGTRSTLSTLGGGLGSVRYSGSTTRFSTSLGRNVVITLNFDIAVASGGCTATTPAPEGLIGAMSVTTDAFTTLATTLDGTDGSFCGTPSVAKTILNGDSSIQSQWSVS